MHAGELVSLFRHGQDGVNDTTLFAEVRWMIELPEMRLVENDPWHDLFVLPHSIVIIFLAHRTTINV